MNPQYEIWSSDKSEAETINYLKEYGVPFKQLVGCYKGVMEISYITPVDNFDICMDMYENQESILLLGDKNKLNERPAQLLYIQKNEKPEDIGTFRQVFHNFALKQDAWTYDPATNSYYICK